MNKIVLEHYPASDLPNDMREGIPGDAKVRVTIEEEIQRPSFSEIRKQLEQVRSKLPRNVTVEEAVQRVRDLRDEWDN
ncbi:MAG: hypothetical protein AB7P20_02925 [Rhizobiaceae bacterium]